MPGRKPTKAEIAKMKVLALEGNTPHAIAEDLDRSPHTVAKYLQSDVFTDPAIQEKVALLQKNEIDDLYLIGGKAKKRLHQLLDNGKTRPIETVAILDRVFQQRRLLEGKSTQNLSMMTKAIQAAQDDD